VLYRVENVRYCFTTLKGAQINITIDTTMTTTAARKTILELQLSRIVKATVEITIRSANAFTLSVEGEAINQLAKVKKFLEQSGRVANWNCDYDQECDMTFAYFDAN
jgi:hypothetical protein